MDIVPIEDWIKTIPYLIRRCYAISEDGPDMHKTINAICIGCISRSEIRSLIDEGILNYWKRVLSRDFSDSKEDDDDEEDDDEEDDDDDDGDDDNESPRDLVREAILYLMTIDPQLCSSTTQL
jgi:hypothetical protein